MKTIYLDKNLYCTRMAYVWDGELWGYDAEGSGTIRNVSNIYKAKIVRVISGLNAAFVDLGKSKTGFLPIESKDINKYKDGDFVLCQVKRDGFGNKDMTVKEDICLAGNYVIFIPDGNGLNFSKKISLSKKQELINLFSKVNYEGGLILRTAAENAELEYILEEIKELKKRWEDILVSYRNFEGAGLLYSELNLYGRLKRDFIHDIDNIITNNYEVYRECIDKAEFFDKEYDLFDYYGLSKDIEDIIEKKVSLPNGGSLVFDYTEACTLIDVNTNKNIGTNDIETTIYETNLLAAREIIRQLSLRNISGAIIIDFINMKNSEHKEELIEALNEYAKLDKISTTVIGMTKLGLVEMTRRKSDLPRDILLLESCKVCNGTGKVLRCGYVFCKIIGKLMDIYRENKPIHITISIASRLNIQDCIALFKTECKRRFPKLIINLVVDESITKSDYRIQI